MLTAYHVVDGDGKADVRRIGAGQSWNSASVVWPIERPPYESDDSSDVALLLVDGDPWISESITPVQWGDVAGHDRIPCVGVGFPDADSTEVRRESFAVRGDIDPLHTINNGMLTVHVNTGIVPKSLRLGSSWSGVSGTALFCQDRLTAVAIIEHKISDTADVLHAIPASRFIEDLSFKDAILRFGGDSGVALTAPPQTVRRPTVKPLTSSSVDEVLACTVEWINAPLMPFPAKWRLRELLDFTLREIGTADQTIYRRDSDSDGTLLVFPASSGHERSLATRMIEVLDAEVRKDWERNNYTRIHPQIRVFMHYGFARKESDGEYTGKIFDELHENRQTDALQDALNGDRIGVICIASDAVYDSDTTQLRESLGKWLNFTSNPVKGHPLNLWIRVSSSNLQSNCGGQSPYLSCLLVACFTTGDSSASEHCSSAASHVKAVLKQISESPPSGFTGLDLQVDSWGADGTSVTVTTERPVVFLAGYVLPQITKSLAIFNRRTPAAVRMNAGIHLIEERAADAANAAVTAARLAAGAQKMRPGLWEGDVTTVCLISTQARSSESDNLADFIDPSRFAQVPENGMEGLIDAWLYLPYSPDMS